MSAIFDFSSVLMIILLMICTSTYLRELRPGIFDGSTVRRGTNFCASMRLMAIIASSRRVISLCFLPWSVFLGPIRHCNWLLPFPWTCIVRHRNNDVKFVTVFLKQPRDPSKPIHHDRSGFEGLCWKMSRVGERMSPYVGASCFFMAFYVLFK